MEKSERLKPRIKIKFKYFVLAHILTLFFALAPNVFAAGKSADKTGNFFNFNQENVYSEPFSKLIEFLNEKKNELAEKQGNFLKKENLFETGDKVKAKSVDEKFQESATPKFSLNLSIGGSELPFVSAAFESIKSFVVDNPKQYLGTVFESIKSFVFPGDSQNSFEYKSPTRLSAEEAGKSAMQEMENLKQQYAEAIDETKAISQKFNLLQTELGKIKNSGVIVREPVIEQRTVEKTIEKIVSGLSQADLDSGLSSLKTELNNLNANLTNQINTLSASSNRQTSAVYQAVSLTNKIDSLTNTTITTPTISNPTITGTLTNQTLSNSGNATISGALGVSGLATFANSTTTNATIADNFWSNGSTYIGDADADALTIRSGVWSLTSAATSTVAMTNGLNFDSNTFVIDPNSNRIGLGTSSPYAKLSVVGPVAAEYFHATSSTATSTFSGQTVAGFAPTLAHTFGSWSVGASGANPLGASFIINPSSAASDSNLLSLSVSGSAKFLVDAEGDVFANAVTVVGGTTLSTTTTSTFTVENNTNLGDATNTDITYFNSRIADSLIPTADNLLDLGDSSNWLRWRTGYFGTSVGIGGTATSTGTQLTTSGAYLIDSGNTLSINTTNNKAISFGTGNVSLPYASSTALTISGNSYLGTVSSGTWNGSIIGVPYGGTGWAAIQSGTIPYGNGSSAFSTTTAGTAGNVLALLNGIPTWTATSTLAEITGTLAVAKGGTGQTSFGQGWLNSDGTTLSASTSPTVNYLIATSTTATSTFPYLSVTINSNLGTVVGGTWQGTAITPTYGGTGQNFSASSGLVNFYSGTASAIATSSLGLLTTNVAEGTNLYWTNDRFDTRLSATTTLPNLTTLLGLTNATTTGITSTNSWLGTIRSGTWNGTAISNQYGGTGLDSSALTGIAQIVSGTWSASSTLSTAFGGTGWGNLQANTVLLGNGAGRIATTSAGTDGYVLALSAGVPTWLATSTLSTITGTLAVAKGGTGATTLTGLLQGNGTSAITGITGTAGQFPYYNGTDTLLATSSLFLATSGNVGIGTSTPDSKLTVFANAADSAVEFSSASGSTYKWTMGLDYSDAGKFKIASSTALGSIDRFTIDGNGYVGIGTSTPARRLDVADSGNNNAQMRLSRETDIYTDFSVAQTTGDLSLSLYGTNADDISLYMPDGSTGANLWVCEGAACPNGISFTGGGNLFVEGVIKYATSTTPKTRRSIILTAAGAIVPATSGAAKTQVDGTNHSYYVLDFDASSDEAAFWQWTMPDSYDNGTIDITYYWEAGATSGDSIFCFQAKGLSANSSEDIDSALSSAVCETDTAQANANDLASMTETNATSNFTAGEYATFKIFRDADAAGDTMTGDARLVKVKIEYGVATESD